MFVSCVGGGGVSASPLPPTSAVPPSPPAFQELFNKYYDTVMPLLMHILTTANAKEHRLMRAKALECISLVGMAVGKDKFRADARTVMGYMQSVQAGSVDPDDPLSSYMLQVGCRPCGTSRVYVAFRPMDGS